MIDLIWLLFFFFQAEDGIRDLTVTGVQTCALPIYTPHTVSEEILVREVPLWPCQLVGWPGQSGTSLTRISSETVCGVCSGNRTARLKIGRASCRERV